MLVELLHHRGCPRADETGEMLRDCLAGLGVEPPIIERVGRYASPTVLINGIDVMGRASASVPADTCRLDLPTRERIVAAVQASVAQRREQQ